MKIIEFAEHVKKETESAMNTSNIPNPYENPSQIKLL